MVALFGALDHCPQGDSRLKRAFAIASLALLLAVPTAGAATIVPHRAVYDLSLSRSGNGAGITGAEGRIAFEIQGSACEGWTVSFRMATRYQPETGEASLVDTQTTSYEGGDALEFRHQVKELVNGEIKDDFRISVSRDRVDAEGEGSLTGSGDEGFVIPAGAAFPMQHQFRLMELGAAGGGRDSSVVFDGSDKAKTYRAISFVGRAKEPGSIADDNDNPEAAALKGLTAWPVTISYFPVTGDQEMPDYQVNLNMYENGVSTGVLLDYGSFSLTGRLSRLEMLDASPCP